MSYLDSRSPMPPRELTVGFVIIGRNEGDRLIRGLQSVLAQLPPTTPIVYVDSGSTDGSLEAVATLGIHGLPLDMSIPFTMARGRNAGWRYLVDRYPELDCIQFMDGDCELIEGWMAAAIAALSQNPQLAAVCGRRRERFPEASPYNQLAEMEWNTPLGEADACGGDALIRVAAIQAVNGYRPDLICGEEPEMCIRMRQQGWRIERIAADMTRHDADMHRFGQWWKRSIRGGWAVAEGQALHGAPPENYMVREFKSGWLWGMVIPGSAIALAPFTQGLSLAILLSYGLLGWRIYQARRLRGDSPKATRRYAYYCTLSKLPQAWGQLSYLWTRWRGQTAQIIEYKSAGTSSPPSGVKPPSPSISH
jgi:glycosyltransferase involved in cell wall biosynthesis